VTLVLQLFVIYFFMFVTNEYTLIIVLLFKDTVNVWSLDRRHAHLDHRLTVGNETYKPYHCETTLSTCGLTEVDFNPKYVWSDRGRL